MNNRAQPSRYYFQTREFGVSDRGLHLLRSGYNYQTIDFYQIHSAKIQKDYELPNWVIVFVFGTFILFAGVDLLMPLLDSFLYNLDLQQLRVIVILAIIPLAGAVFVFKSVRRGTVLRIEYGKKKKDRFALNELERQNKMKDSKRCCVTRWSVNSWLKLKVIQHQEEWLTSEGIMRLHDFFTLTFFIRNINKST